MYDDLLLYLVCKGQIIYLLFYLVCKDQSLYLLSTEWFILFIMDHVTQKLTFYFYLIKNNLASAKEIAANINDYVY